MGFTNQLRNGEEDREKKPFFSKEDGASKKVSDRFCFIKTIYTIVSFFFVSIMLVLEKVLNSFFFFFRYNSAIKKGQFNLWRKSEKESLKMA